MRRNLAAHGVFPPARFFLLAMPDQFYFWAHRTSEPTPIPPDFRLDPTPIFKPYLDRAGLSSAGISEASLELMVASWLSELIHGGGESRLPLEDAAWLHESGFVDALRGGRLEQQ